MTTRRAAVQWHGDLASGSGRVTSSTTGVLVGAQVSWPARTHAATSTVTSPEELIAAAHASCFAMAFAGELKKAGHEPKQLEVNATVSFGQRDGQWGIRASALDVLASVPGLDEPELRRLAAVAKDGCPVSRALYGNVDITVSASLSSEQLAAAAGP